MDELINIYYRLSEDRSCNKRYYDYIDEQMMRLGSIMVELGVQGKVEGEGAVDLDEFFELCVERLSPFLSNDDFSSSPFQVCLLPFGFQETFNRYLSRAFRTLEARHIEQVVFLCRLHKYPLRHDFDEIVLKLISDKHPRLLIFGRFSQKYEARITEIAIGILTNESSSVTEFMMACAHLLNGPILSATAKRYNRLLKTNDKLDLDRKMVIPFTKHFKKYFALPFQMEIIMKMYPELDSEHLRLLAQTVVFMRFRCGRYYTDIEEMKLGYLSPKPHLRVYYYARRHWWSSEVTSEELAIDALWILTCASYLPRFNMPAVLKDMLPMLYTFLI